MALWLFPSIMLLYPGSPVIREWLTITNISTQPVTLSDPGFLESRVMSADVENLDLYYMTGGGAFNGAQLLKKREDERHLRPHLRLVRSF